MTQLLFYDFTTVDGMTVKQMTNYVKSFNERMYKYFWRSSPPETPIIELEDIDGEGRACRIRNILQIRRRGPNISGGLKEVLRHEASHLLHNTGPGAKYSLSTERAILSEIVAEAGNYVGGIIEGRTIQSIKEKNTSNCYAELVYELLECLPISYNDETGINTINDNVHFLMRIQKMNIKTLRRMSLKMLNRNHVFSYEEFEEKMRDACEEQ